MKKGYILITSVILLTLSVLPIKKSNAQDEYKYAKTAYFAFDPEKWCITYIETCTSEPGDQCTQPTGAFRTCITPL